MNRATICLLTEKLIEACGGPQRAAAVCRVSDKHLYRYRDPASDCMMPVDVMIALEREAGAPVMSKALFEAAPKPDGARCIRDEAMEAVEAAADVLQGVRLATVDGEITPRERADILRRATVARAQIDDVIDAAEREAG